RDVRGLPQWTRGDAARRQARRAVPGRPARLGAPADRPVGRPRHDAEAAPHSQSSCGGTMDAITGVIFFWLLFGGTHVGLTVGSVRARLVARLGESGFRGVYSAVAVATFAALVRFYATHRMAGPAGLDLGRHPAVRIVLMGAVVAGLTLMFLMDYTR